jgi:hypothetical protein
MVRIAGHAPANPTLSKDKLIIKQIFADLLLLDHET